MNREEKAESIREIEARLDTTDTIIAATSATNPTAVQIT